MRRSGEKAIKDALKQKPAPTGKPPAVKGGRKFIALILRNHTKPTQSLRRAHRFRQILPLPLPLETF
jgi:hypothetical protein